MLGFGLSNVYCRFLWFKPRFWEKCLRWIQAKKYGLWGSKEACKEAQNTPRIAKPAAQGKAPNKTKTQRTGQTGQPQPVATTGRGGCHGLAVVAAHGRGGRFSPGSVIFLSRASSSSGGFCYFLSLYCNVSGHMEKNPNSLHSISSFIFIVLD